MYKRQVLSTHSNHIVHDISLNDMRYFHREVSEDIKDVYKRQTYFRINMKELEEYIVYVFKDVVGSCCGSISVSYTHLSTVSRKPISESI